jgi:hypothetical protein
MLQQTEAQPSMPLVRRSENPADRRAHPRVPPAKLALTSVRIPHRPSVSLVDLSSGGALLHLPFQIRPESRFALQLETSVEQLSVPIQLLRSYVADLNGGVTYHAAGAFDSLLDVRALMQRASGAAQRLIGAIERLQRGVKKTAAQSRSDAAFCEILGGVLTWLRRGDSLELVTLKVKAHLTQTYPSLLILPSQRPARDEASSVACFGLTLTSRYTLSAHDRRYLKSNAQLISMLEATWREMREELGPEPQPQVVHTAADWITGQAQAKRERSVMSVAASPALRSKPAPVKEADVREAGLVAAFEAMFMQTAAL